MCSLSLSLYSHLYRFWTGISVLRIIKEINQYLLLELVLLFLSKVHMGEKDSKYVGGIKVNKNFNKMKCKLISQLLRIQKEKQMQKW